MEPFTRVTAVGLPIDLPNVDTDRVIPARFLRKDRGVPEYARYLFHDVRFDADGAERPEFILNQPPYRGARIVVAAENFGCGSSREAAVWVLAANGFRSVIAPSLGDIFHQNCFKNGVLPVILPTDVVAGLRRQLHARPGATLTVDLESQIVTAPDGLAFEATARAASGQSDDTYCATFGIDHLGMRTARDAAGADRSMDCWR